ncbi:MAG TPA: hypothetical protein VNX15_10585, partial [Gemmatimonadales bacterium]|nr:hypothetical protein [Gemmatimonadales bacterium]
WVTVGPQRAVGLEATGQRLLMTLGSLVALVLALVPAGLVAGAVLWGAGVVGVAAPWSVALGALAGSGTVGVECWLAVQVLGGVYDRMDPSSAGIP